MRDALIYVYSNSSLVIILIPHPLSRITVFGPPQGLITYLGRGSWPPYQCQVWVPSHEMGIISNEKVVGYFNNIHVTSVSLSIFYQACYCCSL